MPTSCPDHIRAKYFNYLGHWATWVNMASQFTMLLLISYQYHPTCVTTGSSESGSGYYEDELQGFACILFHKHWGPYRLASSQFVCDSVKMLHTDWKLGWGTVISHSSEIPLGLFCGFKHTDTYMVRWHQELLKSFIQGVNWSFLPPKL